MNFVRLNIVLRPVRLFVAVFACLMMVFAQAAPAFAISGAPTSTPTRPSEGSVQMDDIQRKSEEVTKAPPLGMKETQREANRGINEIQGDANKNEMYRPETSQQATSIENKVEQALERITGRD